MGGRRFVWGLGAALLLLALAFLPAGSAEAQGGIIHVVQPGENLFRIGLRYNVDWQTLMEVNGLISTRIYVGQQLVIPAAGSGWGAASSAPAPSAEGTVHTVQPGETLFTIGLRYNLTWDLIASANGLVSSRIYVGQQLVIPGRSAPAPSPAPAEAAAPAATPAAGNYRVEAGDTLWGIAIRFGVSMDALATANQIWNTDHIYVGQVLAIPGGGNSAGQRLAVTGHPQALPLDCESRSAVDWAAFFGVSISELDFFWGLPVSDDPEAGFVGDVYGAWGQIPPAPYGVHAEPVAARLQAFGVPAQAVRDLSWESLRAQVDVGRPVIVWVVGHVEAGSAVLYTASSGRSTLVAPYEHTVIVIGYTESEVTVLDGGTVYSRSLDRFLGSWGVMGNMAVVAP